MRSVRFRRMVFTFYLIVNHYQSDAEYMDAVVRAGGACIKYVQFQREMCPDTGRVHLQGFICFNKKMSRKGVKKLKLFGTKEYWFEASLDSEGKTLAYCVTYCTKEETRIEGHTPMEVCDERSEKVRSTKIHARSACTSGSAGAGSVDRRPARA